MSHSELGGDTNIFFLFIDVDTHQQFLYNKLFYEDNHLRTFSRDSLSELAMPFGFELQKHFFLEDTNQLALKFIKSEE